MAIYGLCTFCDDIRFELQNKFSLIGCYGPDLITPQPPPIVLPKLCVLIQVRMPRQRFPAVSISAYMPNATEPFAKYEQAEEQEFKETELANTDDKDIEQLRGLILPMIFSPLSIEKLGYIKVRMKFGDENIRLGALNIRAPVPGEIIV